MKDHTFIKIEKKKILAGLSGGTTKIPHRAITEIRKNGNQYSREKDLTSSSLWSGLPGADEKNETKNESRGETPVFGDGANYQQREGNNKSSKEFKYTEGLEDSPISQKRKLFTITQGSAWSTSRKVRVGGRGGDIVKT